MARKNLNDSIHGDRASIRGGSIRREEDWQDDRVRDFFGGSSPSGYRRSSKSALTHQSCFHTHPALVIPGTDHVIYGGSCSRPVVKDADVYVGFDTVRFTQRHWPWKKGTEIEFLVPDMGIPDEPDEYRKLLKFVCTAIDEGKKVHCGCIGGHGRTGMFLAAVVSHYGEKDAINYVRKNYCKKAVESTTQVNFLVREFGITKVTGSKERTSRISKDYSAYDKLPKVERTSSTALPAPYNGCIFEGVLAK